MLHQVEDDALATEQHARIVPDHRQHLSRVHAHAVEDLWVADDFKAGLRRGPRIETSKDFKEVRYRAQAGDHHLLAGDNRRRGSQFRGNGEVGGRVGDGPVFHQCLLQQCVDAAALPIHLVVPFGNSSL